MTRRPMLTTALALALLATGCAALDKATGAVASIESVTRATRPGTAKTRALEVKVVAPGALAVGGKILTDAGAGLMNSVAILTDAGAGLQPRYGLRAASVDGFVAVEGAGVRVFDLAGDGIGEPVATDAAGGAKLKSVPSGRLLTVVGGFRADGKVYRLAATLGADDFTGTLMIDPINTMVEARVRDLLAGKESTTITNARLKKVWGICNDAGITVEPSALEAGKPIAEITAALNAAWKAAIDSSVTDADEKAEIQSFIDDLKKLGEKK